jgi:alpha-glucuronidase
MKQIVILILSLLSFQFIRAESGYDLWLRYHKISDQKKLTQYRNLINVVYIETSSQTSDILKNEILNGLKGLLNKTISSTINKSQADLIFDIEVNATKYTDEGFSIHSEKGRDNKFKIYISAKKDIGLLYGGFHFLRILQDEQNIYSININSSPTLSIRILNHWDNLNRSIERGYAGISIFNWHTLPDYIDQRYIDYARANASIGINGTVLTNVNSNATVLTPSYLLKVRALADLFRPYGIKVYLTARFSAPIEIDKLKTADPLNKEVQLWWKNKAKEIYDLIPDFGGFLVKANSEGQPGPQNYGRSHADGANMLADAVAPYNGIIIWRAFVYSNEIPEDRFKQAYNEFKPLDGNFKNNVLVQVKNGPIDFQPREPFHPLFGAMPKTPLMMEVQLTQEYLGQSTHLVYEAPMFKEILLADTYEKEKKSTVASVIDGSLFDRQHLNGMSGVANIGNDINWCGHPFAQSNWYAFGRLTWNTNLSPEEIATEWIKQTFGTDQQNVSNIKQIMLGSYETLVAYMTPLGLHHIMGNGNHYGPLPWGNSFSRADWNPVYYNKADSFGIGFNRTSSGSNALSQYHKQVQLGWADSSTCDENYLLFFHHVSWNHQMKSGRNLWNELCFKYNGGVENVKEMKRLWTLSKKNIDADRFNQVIQLLKIQLKEAEWWRDACLLYFQTFSKQPFPKGFPKPKNSLSYYQALQFPYAPGNGQ